jgi:hypothetical protein
MGLIINFGASGGGKPAGHAGLRGFAFFARPIACLLAFWMKMRACEQTGARAMRKGCARMWADRRAGDAQGMRATCEVPRGGWRASSTAGKTTQETMQARYPEDEWALLAQLEFEWKLFAQLKFVAKFI